MGRTRIEGANRRKGNVCNTDPKVEERHMVERIHNGRGKRTEFGKNQTSKENMAERPGNIPRKKPGNGVEGKGTRQENMVGGKRHVDRKTYFQHKQSPREPSMGL